MGYSEQATLAEDATFKAKVRIAVVKAASAVCGEASTAYNTLDEKRHALAVDILKDGGAAKLPAIAWAAAAAGLTASSTDANFDDFASANWNNLAGVRYADNH